MTLPVALVLWDAFLGTSTSITEIFSLLTKQMKSQSPRNSACILFLVRVVFSAVGTLVLVAWRLHKNGDYIPDFSCEQNPGACLPKYEQRLLHFSWLWVLNLKLLVLPTQLSPDWSGPSVDPMISLTDPRAIALPFLYLGIAGFLYSTLSEAWSEGSRTSPRRSCVRLLLVSWWFMMITFVMSSNLLVHVGFVVADRTLYLPSYGFLCGLTVLLFVIPNSMFKTSMEKVEETSIENNKEDKESSSQSKRKTSHASSSGITLSLAVVVISCYTAKQQAQTTRWADPVELWAEAYKINPKSCINGGEFGMSLTNAQRPLDAVPVSVSSRLFLIRIHHVTNIT